MVCLPRWCVPSISRPSPRPSFILFSSSYSFFSFFELLLSLRGKNERAHFPSFVYLRPFVSYKHHVTISIKNINAAPILDDFIHLHRIHIMLIYTHKDPNLRSFFLQLFHKKVPEIRSKTSAMLKHFLRIFLHSQSTFPNCSKNELLVFQELNQQNEMWDGDFSEISDLPY